MQNESVRRLGYWAKNWKYPLLFAVKHRISTWGALFVFLLLYAVVSWSNISTPNGYPSLSGSLSKNWYSPENHINIFLQFLTLFVVISVWFTQLRQDWTVSLDKFLSVTFVFGGKTYKHLSAKYAPLFSESDIRNLGQSLGQVRYKGSRLPLDSERNKLAKTICFDTSKKICCHPFWHYQIIMPLLHPLEEPNERATESEKQLSDSLDSVVTNVKELGKKLEDKNSAILRQVIQEFEQAVDSAGKQDIQMTIPCTNEKINQSDKEILANDNN